MYLFSACDSCFLFFFLFSPQSSFAIHTLAVRGDCECHRSPHQCAPSTGVCSNCTGNTCGDNCDMCCPLANQQPMDAMTGACERECPYGSQMHSMRRPVLPCPVASTPMPSLIPRFFVCCNCIVLVQYGTSSGSAILYILDIDNPGQQEP